MGKSNTFNVGGSELSIKRHRKCKGIYFRVVGVKCSCITVTVLKVVGEMMTDMSECPRNYWDLQASN